MMEQNRIMIFAGAGASKAVDPKQYPTTVEFFDGLPSQITNDDLFKSIVQYIKANQDTKAVDIEVVLWQLEALAQFCKLSTDQSQLPGWLLHGQRLAKSIGQPNHNVGNLVAISQAAQNRVKKLRDGINEQVYKLYSKLPQPDQLENTWLKLLRPLVKNKTRLDVVTTNYDVILETALDALEKEGLEANVETGWVGAIHRILDQDLWAAQPHSGGLLTKLHGSVNWTRDGDQIFVGDPTFKGSHSRHAIIYPGFKGRPSDPLFQSFHRHFRNVLSECDAIVFIGFAFRDEHINDICDRTVAPKSLVVVIDPASDTKLPFDHPADHTTYIRAGFDSDSATKAVHELRSLN